jgi:hypothetical protein
MNIARQSEHARLARDEVNVPPRTHALVERDAGRENVDVMRFAIGVAEPKRLPDAHRDDARLEPQPALIHDGNLGRRSRNRLSGFTDRLETHHGRADCRRAVWRHLDRARNLGTWSDRRARQDHHQNSQSVSYDRVHRSVESDTESSQLRFNLNDGIIDTVSTKCQTDLLQIGPMGSR